MTSEARPRLEKRPPPKLDLRGGEWKLVASGALGLVWALAWLALAKPIEPSPAPVERAQGASPRRAEPPARLPAPPAAAEAPRAVAAAPTRRPPSRAIRVRTRSS